MARWEVEDFGKSILDKLDNDTNRKIRREMVRNGAKVLQKEMQLATEARHHVVNHWMKDSIAAGEVHEDIDGVSIEVYPQGEDPRGVSNEMKMQIINHGYYHVLTGEKRGKKDFFLNDKFRKKCAPRIVSVMQATLAKCMEQINK